jgi:hypothetical protein
MDVKLDAIAVELDFVDPSFACRYLLAAGLVRRKARGHAKRIARGMPANSFYL